MRSILYLSIILLMLYIVAFYYEAAIPATLRDTRYNWTSSSVHTINILLTVVEFIAVFLGGFLAVFLFPLAWLLVISFVSVIMSILTFDRMIWFPLGPIPKNTDHFFNQIYVWYAIATVFLFGIFFGFFKFILLVIMLDQNKHTSINYAMTSYIAILNISSFIVCAFMQINVQVFAFIYGLPLILLSIALLVFGWRTSIYIIESSRNRIGDVINPEATLSLLSIEQNEKTWFTFSKLCIAFVIILPFSIGDSQLGLTYIWQSRIYRQPEFNKEPLKGDFWVYAISSLGVPILILVFEILRRLNTRFNNFYSTSTHRIIASYVFMFLSLLTAGVVETIRLNKYNNSKIDGVSEMSVFYMTPQIIFNAISEILILSCVKSMYLRSKAGMRCLAVAFFVGVIGTGGVGDFLSTIFYIILKEVYFDISSPKYMHYWFYILAGFLCISGIPTLILLKKNKDWFHYEREYISLENDIINELDQTS